MTTNKQNAEIGNSGKQRGFILSREFTRDALQKIEHVQRTWESLFGQASNSGHYGRYQLRMTGKEWCKKSISMPVVIEGQRYQGHIRLVTAKAWFAMQLYEIALAATKTRYSDWDLHRYQDGPRAGERVLEFLSEEHELGWGHLWISSWELDPPTVTEQILVEPCSDGGYTEPVALTKRYGNTYIKDHRLVTVVLNRPEVGQEDLNEISQALCAGKELALSNAPCNFSFKEIEKYFVELSSPELSVLNWADSMPPLSVVDRDFLNAIDAVDQETACLALKRGANPNAIEIKENYPIYRLIDRWETQSELFHATEDELANWGKNRPMSSLSESELSDFILRLVEMGSNPDIFVPDECPAIVHASLGCYFYLVKALLQAGAQASVNWASDSYPSDWPQAWDSPSFDAFHENDEDARAIYDLLLLHRPSPIFKKEREDEGRIEAELSLSGWLEKNQVVRGVDT